MTLNELNITILQVATYFIYTNDILLKMEQLQVVFADGRGLGTYFCFCFLHFLFIWFFLWPNSYHIFFLKDYFIIRFCYSKHINTDYQQV